MKPLPTCRCPRCGAVWTEDDWGWLFYNGSVFHLCFGQYHEAEVVEEKT